MFLFTKQELTNVSTIPCLSLRKFLISWKTSTDFSVNALSMRFHKAQKIPVRDDPLLEKN